LNRDPPDAIARLAVAEQNRCHPGAPG